VENGNSIDSGVKIPDAATQHSNRESRIEGSFVLFQDLKMCFCPDFVAAPFTFCSEAAHARNGGCPLREFFEREAR
jgi:hypothetical protein